MSESIRFTLDGRAVEASPGETIWQAATRLGSEIPHLCHAPEPGYRPDGNCRACMVEIEGERVLAASCIRKPTEGMKVSTASERAAKSRRMVFELLMADQPAGDKAHDPESKFWNWAGRMGVADSRFPAGEKPAPDASHPAMRLHLDACIQCGLCVRACREVQVNDVIGMAFRGGGSKVVFDFDDAMGNSTCVACGECVQACPTGALMEASLLDDAGARTGYAEREVDTLCPFCGVGCQTTVSVRDEKIIQVDGRAGPANENRLCVKGRFGYDYIHHPHRLTRPMIRRDDAPKAWDCEVDPDELPDGEYPLVLSTGRLLEHWHTGAMSRRAQVLDDVEPEAIVCLSPGEIGRLGVAPGDFMTVSTRRGAVALKVRQDTDVPDGMVFIPFCFAEAAANLLTNPQFDPFGKIPEFKFCAARIEAAGGAAAAE